MSAMVCSYCGGPHRSIDCGAWQAKWLALIVVIAIAMIVVATDLAVSYWIYGDPLCSFKTCAEIKSP